ncbi:Starch-binding associating with outer membrane [Chitinophaga terrae (ex Kim and Jung 2007)]|uniref:Starch-binding associating with outer membrane n=1 Tax=Chitinophaga terrae (ex Kim and Jung 2007) TaxID=408074 RepID=A0A1H3XC91_9BACT|nr:RagB/SusD family nutrient uptake outer membrane protein [Chitinophaga terrae (ex Kim and Jung 2007)]SDZ96284.1 Starch-binding associating with outer membrane [Chitinophaga terrae (ex Kim and Jung 2007)]
MKKNLLFILLTALLGVVGCTKDDNFLSKDPTDILLDDQVWKDSTIVLAVVADMYDRYPDFQTIENWGDFTAFDEGFASEAGSYWRHHDRYYGYGSWGSWNYGYVRELNLFLEKCAKADKLTETAKTRLSSEVRFLRAVAYFDMVKRMGGVPLILESMTYDYKNDPTYLRRPRAKESEIYDFVIKELDEIKNLLPDAVNIKSRATKWAVLAVQARAALYAGSIAKYGATLPQVSLPGGEVGIPAAMATGYYTKALAAAEEIIKSNAYSLYQRKANLSENFSSLFTDKNSNPEAIFVKDFKLQSGKVQGWTLANQPRTSAEEQQGGRLNPSLNLVQSFELLDNTFAPFVTNTTDGNYVYYTSPVDIFAGRDARLAGTVILPGTEFKNKKVDIYGGIVKKDGSIVSGDAFGKVVDVDGARVQVIGVDGPVDRLEFGAQTGFFVRKYMDPTTGSGQIGTQSDVWWIRYRYAEVLLNAAEAAFELGNTGTAATYMNQVRARAGLVKALQPGEINFNRIVHERKVELAFEGHELWDYKRWRIAHKVWNGQAGDLTTDIGNATASSTRVFGLVPYKVYNPGDPTNGKWVFRKIKPAEVTEPHEFRLGNYYSFIDDNIRNNNPLIVKNPNQ